MSDINFINRAGGGGDDEKDNGSRGANDEGPVEWSDPDPSEQGRTESSGGNREGLRAQRSLSGKMKNLFQKSEKPPQSANFTDDKKNLAEHKDTLDKEKRARSGNGAVKAPSAGNKTGEVPTTNSGANGGGGAADQGGQKADLGTEKKQTKPTGSGTADKTESADTDKEAGDKPKKKFSLKTRLLSLRDRLTGKDQDIFAGGGLKTNLIQGEVTAFFNWHKHGQAFLMKLFYVGILIVAAYAGLLYWESGIEAQSRQLGDDINKLTLDIHNMEKQLMGRRELQKKLEAATTLFEKHPYWTNLFSFIEAKTLPTVKYAGGFAGRDDGRYGFKAIAPDYESVARQVLVLQSEDMVANAAAAGANLSAKTNINDGSGSDKAVNFDLNVHLKREIFYK